jgi:hypothetical protein
MATKFQVISRAIKASKKDYCKDLVIVVFQRENGDYSWALEVAYTGDEDKIIGRYLNGSIVPYI